MLLSGVFDRFPKLNVLIAHSGGTLPFLAGRIESCIAHDAHLARKGTIGNRRDVWHVLKTNIYLDAVIYSDTGLKAAVEVSGADRLMFGRSNHTISSSRRGNANECCDRHRPPVLPAAQCATEGVAKCHAQFGGSEDCICWRQESRRSSDGRECYAHTTAEQLMYSRFCSVNLYLIALRMRVMLDWHANEVV